MPSAEQGQLEALVTISGPFLRTFRSLIPDTLQHADEIMYQRRAGADKKLRDEYFWVADSALYTTEGKKSGREAFLRLGRGDTNPIFTNLEEAIHQLRRCKSDPYSTVFWDEQYIPNAKNLQSVMEAEGTLKARLLDLDLKVWEITPKSRFSFGAPLEKIAYFEIETANYDVLNPTQRLVAERIYGQGDDFKENMAMLHENGVTKTQMYFLNPEFVVKKVKEGQAFAQACCLTGFGNKSLFSAYGSYSNDYNSVRGVLVPAVRERHMMPLRDAYKTILMDPTRAVEVITPEIASGMAGILKTYEGRMQSPAC